MGIELGTLHSEGKYSTRYATRLHCSLYLIMEVESVSVCFSGTVSNIPSGMVADQFGMVGLLAFIRAAESDPNLVALAPGIDLTTLGLNLNSPEYVF